MQHPIADLPDQAALAGARKERRRQQLPAGPVLAAGVPAQERLGGQSAPACERDYRLVDNLQLFARQRVCQTPLGLQVRLRLKAQALAEDFHAGAAAALGPVHRHVRLSQHRLGVCLGIARESNAHACGHRNLGASDDEGPAQGLKHPLGESQGFGFAFEVLGQDHELVAAEARHGVAVSHHLFEPARDEQQEPVPDVVAEAVVDGLEAVEIHEQERDETAAAMQARERLVRTVHEQQTVGQPREGVVQRLALERLAVGLAVRDVLCGGVPLVVARARTPQQGAP